MHLRQRYMRVYAMIARDIHIQLNLVRPYDATTYHFFLFLGPNFCANLHWRLSRCHYVSLTRSRLPDGAPASPAAAPGAHAAQSCCSTSTVAGQRVAPASVWSTAT